MIIFFLLFHQSAKNTQQTTATNENNSDYKEINMHSNKMAFAWVIVMGLGMTMTHVWAADSVPATTPTTTEEKTTVQTDSNAATEPQVEVKIEDIDAPILE